MAARKKEFDEKRKAENNKLSREKMYLKDKQTSGKADYMLKADIEELKNKLEEADSDKKKLRTDKDR